MEKKTIYKQLLEAQKEFKSAIKDSDNPFFKSKYADLTSVWEACKDALHKNGLFVAQSPDIFEGFDVLITRIYNGEGEFLESKIRIVTKSNNDPQAFGSALTYARRYALAAILGIITEDDDAEGAMQRELEAAIKELLDADSIDKVRKVWDKHKPLHANERFKAEAVRRKVQLTNEMAN